MLIDIEGFTLSKGILISFSELSLELTLILVLLLVYFSWIADRKATTQAMSQSFEGNVKSTEKVIPLKLLELFIILYFAYVHSL